MQLEDNLVALLKKQKIIIKIHTLTQHAVAKDHAPPSTSLHPSNPDNVIRCLLKTVEFEDIPMQTSPESSHPKSKKHFNHLNEIQLKKNRGNSKPLKWLSRLSRATK